MASFVKPSGMKLSSFRWRISDAVQRLMLTTDDRHPVRLAYNTVRMFPPVKALWRWVSGDNDRWRHVDAYEAAGGVFASGARGGGAGNGGAPSLEFGESDYFRKLIEYASADGGLVTAASSKVMLVNNGLAAGGAERQIIYTANGLKERGCEPVFVGEYLNQAPGLDFHAEALRATGVGVMGLPRSAKPDSFLYQLVSRPVAVLLAKAPTKMMLEMLDMVALIKRQAPAVVHLWQDETSIKHGLAAVIAGAPRVVLSGRNMNPTHFQYFLPHMRDAYRALAEDERVILSNNSIAGAASYAEWLNMKSSDFTVVRNGVDPALWPAPGADARQIVRARHGLSPAQPVVTGVFRLSPEKQPLVWLEAAAALRASIPAAAFFLIGDGPMRDALTQKAQALGLGDALTVVGETRAVHDYLAAGDLFLLASRQEGLPNVLLEAQWHGLACVTTDAGGAPEAIKDGETGVVVPLVSGNLAQSLADALASAWRDEAFRAAAREKGPAFVRQHFSLERMIDQTLSLYGFQKGPGQ